MSSVAGLSKYIRTLPKTGISIFSMIFISFIVGVLIFFISPKYFIIDTLDISILEKIFYGGAYGFGVLGISSIISGTIVQHWVSSMKGINLKTKHAMFLAMISMVFLSIVTIFGAIFSILFNGDYVLNSILFGCVLIFAFSILVLWSTSNIGLIKSVFISCIQPVFVISMWIILTFINQTGTTPEFKFLTLFLKVIVAGTVFLLAIFSFITIIESPLKKNLGLGLLDLLSLFIAHINEGSKSLEKLFEEIGEPVDTLVGILSFKRDNKIKAIFISPFVHPGPIGDIGGANMPSILSKRFDAFTMVAHGPSTHDFNPVSAKEIDKIETTVKNALEEMEYSPYCSQFIKYSNKKANIGIQFFGNNGVILATFAPYGSDDIELSVGLSLMIKSQSKCNLENSVIVDCHNSFDEESGRLLPGNPKMFQLLDTVDEIKKTKQNKGIRLGCHHDLMDDLDKSNGVGEDGLKVMIIETMDQKTAYILFDSNNMLRGFREKIIGAVKDLGLDEVEVMTTDTHSVNTLASGYNPIGQTKQDEIIEHVKSSCKKAVDDLEEVEASIKTKRIIGINTFGPNNSTELISTISSIVAVSKVMAPLIFILAILFAFLWIFFYKPF
jgi:putative membrane protein